MVLVIAVAFLAMHAFVHVAVWAMPQPPERPASYDPHRSWILRAAHVATPVEYSSSVWLGWAAGALYALAAVALAVDVSSWEVTAIAAAIVGLVLKAGWFNRWLALGVVLDLAVLFSITAAWPPSLF